MQRQFRAVRSRIICGLLAGSLGICTPMATSLVGVTSGSSPVQAQTANGRFQIVGSKIYDPNGKEFLIKGTNMNGPNFVWPGDIPSYADSVKNCWGFNAIRLNVYALSNGTYLKPDQNAGYSENGTIDQIVNAYTSKGVVVIIAAHEHTGEYFKGQDLENLKGFYRTLATKYKNNSYVWFNIQNEPGASKDDLDQWVSMHQAAIKTIRDEVGADNLIMVDGHFWGQDVGEWNSNPVNDANSAILSSANQLMNFNGKTYQNIVFSVHMYDQWVYSQQKMGDYFDRVLAKKIPIVVGEFGVVNGSANTQQAVEYMYNTAPTRNVGRLVWAWWGGDDNKLTTSNNGGGEYVNSCQNPSNLTWLGQHVWSDIRRKETLGSIGQNPSPIPTPTPKPTPSPSPTPTPTPKPTPSPSPTPTPKPTTTPAPAPIGKAGSFPNVTAALSIDSDWSSIPAYKIQNLNGDANGDGGSVRGAWDSNNLYLLYEVTDKNKIATDNTDTFSFWKSDGVEIYLDPTNSKTSSYQSNDYSIGLHWQDKKVHGLLERAVPAGTTFTQKDTATGYKMAVKIPFASLGITPKEGYKLGFDSVINDADTKGDRARFFQLFDDTNNAWNNPSVFGTITLTSQSPQNAVQKPKSN